MILRCIVNHDEEWRGRLNLFYDATGHEFPASTPLDFNDRKIIRGLRSALSTGHGK